MMKISFCIVTGYEIWVYYIEPGAKKKARSKQLKRAGSPPPSAGKVMLFFFIRGIILAHFMPKLPRLAKKNVLVCTMPNIKLHHIQ